jgi:hypothetical protein
MPDAIGQRQRPSPRVLTRRGAVSLLDSPLPAAPKRANSVFLCVYRILAQEVPKIPRKLLPPLSAAALFVACDRTAGASEGEVMKLCGWETRSMFDRYNIIDEADLAAAVSKRFASGTLPAHQGPPEPSRDSLTSDRHTS